MIQLRACFALGLLSSALLMGCGKVGPEPVPVRGIVSLDGAPLAQGIVYFKNVQSGDVDPLPVKEGKFEGKALPGDRRVEVAAYRMIPITGEMGGEVQESLIASRFNSQSTLTAVVTPTGPNEFKFETMSK